MPKSDPLDVTLSVAQSAELFGRSTRWIKSLRSDGFIPTGPRQASLRDVARGVVAYFEAKLKEGTRAEVANKASLARTREIELRTAERARKLIPVEDSLLAMSEIAQMVKAEFSGLPARVTRDRDLRRKMEEEIDGIFARLAEKVAQRGEDIRSGKVALDDI